MKLFDAILDFDAALDWPFDDDDLLDLGAGATPESVCAPVGLEPVAS